MQNTLSGFLCVWLLLLGNECVSGTLPRAQNVTWNSFNFKTILIWGPEPVNYSYTVEFYKQGQDRQRSPICIQMSETECDLTAELKDLKSRYAADVVSEPVKGATSDLVEFPHTTSPLFIPYEETIISKPQFRITQAEDGTITLNVEDMQTAILDKQNKMLTLREIFKDDLKYKVFYRKAKSTGKKELVSSSSQIEMKDLDKGESYCFIVQAFIPSRKISKQLGELSSVQCSQEQGTSIFEEYSIMVIAAVILIIIVIIIAVIVGTVLCCRHLRRTKNGERERVPLKNV